MKFLCVIPSRIASTRLPRKALLSIQGKPMIQWVYENAKRCTFLEDVIVATDSEEIVQVVEQFRGKVVLTESYFNSGTERVAAVAAHYKNIDVVINVQGDEPFVRPSMIEQLIAPYLKNEAPDMTTLACPLSDNCYKNPGVVKVITDTTQNAIYFSRSPIPFYREKGKVPVYRHMGLYAFKREFLLKYSHLQRTPLESVESLEQLRVLEHGYKIRVCLTEQETLDINTEEEYEAAQHYNYIFE